MKPLTRATEKFLRPLNLHKRDRLSLSLDNTGDKFIAEIYQIDPFVADKRCYPSYEAGTIFPARLLERKKLVNDKWEFPATEMTVELIASLWPDTLIEFTDEAKIVFDYIRATAMNLDRNAERTAEFRENHKLPNDDIEINAERPLAEYQLLAAINAMNSEGYGLFMEQGTGKTPVVIARVCNKAVRLREGGIDWGKVRSSEETLKRKFAQRLEEELKDIDKNVTDMIKRKREKLERGARLRAEKMQVHMEYTGSAAGALAKAREVVRNAELWLSNRMREIALDMQWLEKIYREENEAKKQRIREDNERALKREIELMVKPRLKGENRMYRAIVVCPKNVRANWKNEFEAFGTRPGVVTVLRGGDMERTKLLIDTFAAKDCDYAVVVCSYETMVRSWKVLKHINWDLAVLDEGHYIKSPYTQRTKQAWQLRDNSSARMVLTGTPIANTPLDLFAQFEFLGKGWSGFSSWDNFRKFYGVYEANGQTGREMLVGMQNLPFMQERLARMSYIIRKEEALPNLPDKVYDVYEVDMTSEQREIYEQVRDQLAVEIENELDASDNKQLTINNVLTKLLRLAQITAGFVKWDAIADPDTGDVLRPSMIDRFDPSPKIEACLELIKEKGPLEKTMIWTCWVQNIKSLSAALTLAGIKHVTFYGGTSDAEREEAERLFNEDPECKVFIGNPAAGGTGLNLLGYPPKRPDDAQTNCTHIIYFSQGWSSIHRSQSEDRAHRRGTRVPVRITDLCVPGTIDEEIRTRVLKKRMIAYAVSDVKEILRNVLRGVLDNDE